MPLSSRFLPTPIVSLPAVQRYGFSRRPSCLTSCAFAWFIMLGSMCSPINPTYFIHGTGVKYACPLLPQFFHQEIKKGRESGLDGGIKDSFI